MRPMLLTFSLVIAAAITAADSRPSWIGALLSVDHGPEQSPVWLTVRDIAPGSPAEQAGVHRGDLVTEIDGRPLEIRDPLDLILLLANAKPGKVMTWTILRARQRHTVEIVPVRMPDPQYEQWKVTLAQLKARRAQAAAAKPQH